MGIGGISIWQLLIVLLIVVMVFGTKKLRNMGSDMGAAVKGFRKGMEDDKGGEEPAEQLEADSDDEETQTTSASESEVEQKAPPAS